MSKIYPVPADVAAKTRVTAAQYEKDYAESVKDAEGFWGRVGKRLAIRTFGR